MPFANLNEQLDKLQAVLPPSMRINSPPQIMPECHSYPQGMIYDPHDGRLYESTAAYQSHMNALVQEQCRQLQSAKKYKIQEDNEIRLNYNLSYEEANALLKSCEGDIARIESLGCLSLEDEGIFKAREKLVPYYFENMTGWRPTAWPSPPNIANGFLVAKERLDTLPEQGVLIVTRMINTILEAQKRRVALERNRRRLHVLIEDGLRSIDLHNAFINALNVYGAVVECKRRMLTQDMISLQQRFAEYKSLVLDRCVVTLRSKRHIVTQNTTFLNHCRCWIEDILERAVRLEMQVQQTIDELILTPTNIPHVAPPDISAWMAESEQVAHSCATVSFMITTDVELNPRKLRHEPVENEWLLGVQRIENFLLVTDASSSEDEI